MKFVPRNGRAVLNYVPKFKMRHNVVFLSRLNIREARFSTGRGRIYMAPKVLPCLIIVNQREARLEICSVMFKSSRFHL